MRTSIKREANAFTKFRLLMWKNFLQQWRHPLQTATEVLLPVLTTTLVLILRWQIEPIQRDSVTFPPIPAYSLNHSLDVLMVMNLTRMSIAYSPKSPMLEDVVRSAMANLITQNARNIAPILEEAMPGFPDISEWPDFPDLSNITWPPDSIEFPSVTWPPEWPDLSNVTLPPEWPDLSNMTWPPNLANVTLPPGINENSTIHDILKLIIRVDGYNNSEALRGIYSSEPIAREVVAAVQFHDSLYGATELPMDLSYELRFPERLRLNSFLGRGGRTWRTDSVFPAFEFPGPRFPFSWAGGNDPGYVIEMFIALQHSISTELIARLTGKEEIRQFNVQIQRYPHPSYVEDLAVEALQFLFPSFILLSFSYTAVNIVRAITTEKELQLKETMKIMGLPTWLHWTAWFSKQFIYLLLTATLVLVLLKVSWFTNEDGFGDYAVFTNTPWTVLLFFIVLYLVCTIFFCFMISGFFSKGGTAALFTGIIWMLSYIPALLLSMDNDVSLGLQVFTCLSLNCAMSFGFQILLGRESTGGLQWGEFMQSPTTDSNRFVFGHVIIMMSVNCVLYMLIALYLEQVLPGSFGMPQKWYFPIQKSFWFPKKTILSDDNFDDSNTDDIVKEKDPTGHFVGVEMNRLTRVFGANVAVDNLSLKIYDDQITVLLGHNGAGKSTTMAMLTGNLQATHGSVTVAGYDVATQGNYARAHLGFCPQHNVLFNELTVREHLEFFARLKGFTGDELYQEIDNLIEKLELQDKRDYQSQGLSGGQKRRLSVGIALSSAARVVLLDEPTSGMDPASRRALWDLLQREKKGRSMILTTHFMDEADILGDRIAIMASGKLQCVGSPYFLKRHYGLGYTLVIVKNEDFNFEACTKLLEKYIPSITIKQDRVSEITYTLATDYSNKFEAMLKELEDNAEQISIKNYGLIPTTLEDVFMSVGSDVALVHSVSDDGAGTSDASSDDLLKLECDSMEQLNKDTEIMTGFPLIRQHVKAIWLKLWLVWIRSWWLIILQVLVPVLLMNASLYVLQIMTSLVPSIQDRLLSLEEGYTRTETFLSYNGTEGINSGTLGALARRAYELIYNESTVATMGLTTVDNQMIDQYYLSRGENPMAMGAMRHSVLTGATFDDNSATAWFSNFAYHDVATSLASIHAALLKSINASALINVFNHPLEATYEDQRNIQMMVQMLSMQVANGVGSSVGIVSAVFIMFYIKERASGAKLLQKAAGIQPIVLWGSSAVFDWFWFLIVCVTIIISCAIFQVIGLSTAAELGNLYLCFMLYGAAMLPLIYILSHLFNGAAIGFVVVFFLNVLFGMMGAQIVEALSAPQLTTQDVADIIDYILQFFPLYNLVTCVRKLNQIGLIEYTCLQGCDFLAAITPNMGECTMELMCNFTRTCCIQENSHLKWNERGVLRYLVVLMFSAGVFWSILMFIEYRIFYKVFRFKKTPPPIDETQLDKDVADEARHVHRINNSSLADHGLVAKNLSKYYGAHLAVDQVSFSVSDSECFGLLGVNGAGKTSTFKMLMGDETISSGDAYVSGYSVQRQLTDVYQNIGYCPQFDALFGELTGRETLHVFSMLRGLHSDVPTPRAEILAQSLGFRKHLDKRVDQYSGGTKRKLNTALAFLGNTRLVFMDEPTTGVDPAAKRHVWRAVRGVQRSGRGVVLTSHSMEECEALCSRLTIMVNGRFQCLGTPQHLKNIFSQGFTLTIKLLIPDDASAAIIKNIADDIKSFVNTNFVRPRIMEEYQGLLTYYLPDRSIPWSRMFGIMENAKRDLLIEDYNISQTTLEQIFLQFTKYQREGH
ncbi:ATP-binding cassette sub-family A member 2 [Manduca sexta]|nr:ATP-binding cassette sub-family A member 2 [Manduca sexta]KAG6447126.1 hypothetical protein O3G_MSEX004751 [Manduca sexta]KAG6447127.1 hypothetical protein O3G_MSEX004751 [Manduca sexta]